MSSQNEGVREKLPQAQSQVHPDERNYEQKPIIQPESKSQTVVKTYAKGQILAQSDAQVEIKANVETEAHAQIKPLNEAHTQAQINRDKQLDFEAKRRQVQQGQPTDSPQAQVNSAVSLTSFCILEILHFWEFSRAIQFFFSYL